MDYAVQNDGRFALQVLGLDRSQSNLISSLRWAPVNGQSSDGTPYEPGLVSESLPFPVTLKPHSQVILEVNVTQPRGCKDHNAAIDPTITQVPVRWSALGVHHTWFLELQASQFIAKPVVLCPTRSVLAHLVH